VGSLRDQRLDDRQGRTGVSGPRELLLVAAEEVVDEHLLNGLVVGFEDVADGVSADEVADFFGEVFGVIAGALERLGHKDDLQAGLMGNVFRVFDVAKKNQIAKAIDFGVGAEDVDGLADLVIGEGDADIGEHFFEDGSHAGEVAGVIGIDASGGGLSAVGEAEEQVADALEADHELHAGEKFASLSGLDFGDDGGDGAVDFHVEGIEFALALAQGIQQRSGAGSNTFSGGAGGVFGDAAGFDGAANDVLVGGFGGNAFDASSAHEVSLWREGSWRSDWL